jgi:carbohydrate-binding DOMON domain-containing protein
MRFFACCVAFLLLISSSVEAGPRCRGNRCSRVATVSRVTQTQTTTVQTTTVSTTTATSDFGASAHAAYLASIGQLVHAPSPTGVEVLCAGCNPQTAVVIWTNSPPHRALLPRVRVIRCVGGVCVGR